MKSGREQLHDWLARRQLNQREGADVLDMHEVSFGQILNGQRGVGLDVAIRIEEQTGIPVRSWGRSAKRNEKRRKQGEATRAARSPENADIARR